MVASIEQIGEDDGVQTKTSPFSTRDIIWVN